jgi:hypothetical protein
MMATVIAPFVAILNSTTIEASDIASVVATSIRSKPASGECKRMQYWHVCGRSMAQVVLALLRFDQRLSHAFRRGSVCESCYKLPIATKRERFHRRRVAQRFLDARTFYVSNSSWHMVARTFNDSCVRIAAISEVARHV